MAKEWYGRIQHKYDTEENWKKAVNFIPLEGELIIYGKDAIIKYDRFKVGDGTSYVNDLPFTDELSVIQSMRVIHEELLLSDILNTYVLNVDYSSLAFDTSEIIFDSESTNIIGQAILGKLVLA